MIKTLLAATAIVAASLVPASAQHATDDKSKVSIVYDHVLPNVPGKSIKGVLVEYEPGGSSPAHTHPSSAFIYATVLEGEIRSLGLYGVVRDSDLESRVRNRNNRCIRNLN